MWNVQMYELLATERIASYQREAALDRLLRVDKIAPSRGEAPQATVTGTPGAHNAAHSTRRALAAAFVGLAAFGALRWRR